MPAGGLDDDRWVPCPNPDFLFPVKVLAALFRGKFLDAFKAAIAHGDIQLHGVLHKLAGEPAGLDDLIDRLYKTDWLVYVKPPFAGPAAVIKYLGRYTHRIAIANSRLVSVSDTHVSFWWKDYADGNKSKIMTLAIGEFIRRFLLHVMPRGYVRIRYYGFLSCRSRREKLQLCRDQTDPDHAGIDDSPDEDGMQPVRQKARVCAVCRTGNLRWYMEIPRPTKRQRRADENSTHDPGGGMADAA